MIFGILIFRQAQDLWCQREESDLRPVAYETTALPLSYVGGRAILTKKSVDFLLPGPAFDLGLAFESGGFIRLLFGIDYFDGFVGAGIGSAPAFLMV